MEDDKKVPLKCYLCGETVFQVLATKEQMRFECFGMDKEVLKCMGCGLVQLLPQWTQEELDYLYTNYWNKEDFKGQKRKVKVSKWLEKFMRKDDWILEVGCGHGDNVNYFRSKGFDVMGIDKDPSANAFTIDYKDFVPNGWDMIYAMHLFEHLTDPFDFIKWLIKKTRKGGIFVLEIPSYDNILMKLKRYRKFAWYPYHLFFFDMLTLQMMFSRVFRDPSIEMPRLTFSSMQEYGIINHLRWLIFGRPGNWNPHIPILDDIYKSILLKLGKGDTLVVVGNV